MSTWQGRGITGAILAALAVAVTIPVARPAIGQARPAASARDLLRFERDVPLGPPQRRFDYQSLDPATGRLYVAEMSAGRLLVFDTRTVAAVAEVGGTPLATGVLAVPDLERVFVSAPGDEGRGQLVVFDSISMKLLGRVPAGRFPDGLAYDSRQQQVWISDERGKALIVVDAVRNALVGRVDLDGEVGNVRFDPLARRIYAPVQSDDALVVVDPDRRELVGRHALPGCRHPHGLYLDPLGKTAWIACDANDVLVAVDLATGRTTERVKIAGEPDVLAFDPGWSRLYVAGESGDVSILDVIRPTHPRLLVTTHVASNAHTVAVDEETHRLYFPIADVGAHAVMRILAGVR